MLTKKENHLDKSVHITKTEKNVWNYNLLCYYINNHLYINKKEDIYEWGNNKKRNTKYNKKL